MSWGMTLAGKNEAVRNEVGRLFEVIKKYNEADRVRLEAINFAIQELLAQFSDDVLLETSGHIGYDGKGSAEIRIRTGIGLPV